MDYNETITYERTEMENFAYFLTGFLAIIGLTIVLMAAHPKLREFMHSITTPAKHKIDQEDENQTEPTPLRSTGT